MAVDVKICGLRNRQTVDAAVRAGAKFIGFNFYPPSPRAVTPEQAIDLGRTMPTDCVKVGVMVDPIDELIEQTLPALDAFQLHGRETLDRVQAIKDATGKTVIKGMSVGDRSDLEPVAAFAEVADMILFDAKPPKTAGSLPGGNGLSFDWRLLDGLKLPCPWILSGGLHADNLDDAVRLCRAQIVDVASGVESGPGIKDVGKIEQFLDIAASLSPPTANV